MFNGRKSKYAFEFSSHIQSRIINDIWCTLLWTYHISQVLQKQWHRHVPTWHNTKTQHSTTGPSPLPFHTTTASNDFWLGWIWWIVLLLLLVPLKHKKRLNQLQAGNPSSREERIILYCNLIHKIYRFNFSDIFCCQQSAWLMESLVVILVYK